MARTRLITMETMHVGMVVGDHECILRVHRMRQHPENLDAVAELPGERRKSRVIARDAAAIMQRDQDAGSGGVLQ